MTQPSIQAGFTQVGDSLVRELGKYLTDPSMISLAGGYPGSDLFDVPGLSASMDKALSQHSIASLQYGPSDGLPMLRASIAQWMQQLGTPCEPDELMITGGSQQGFDLCTRLLMAPGDLAWVERPTYTGPLRRLRLAQARVEGMPVDAQGLVVEALAERLKDPKAQRPKLLYVVPTFANPSGATLSLERRLQLLALAVEHRMVIVEDDPYGCLRWQGDPIPHLAALAHQVPGARDWVVHLGSFSKIIAPGLRVAWMLAPPAMRKAAILAKQLDDLSNPGITQVAVADYVDSGRLNQHLPRIVQAYRERAMAMMSALRLALPQAFEFHEPDGGMFIWGALSESRSSRDLLPYAIEEKVTFVCGDVYFADEPQWNTLRLSFANPKPEVITQGIARLQTAVARMDDPKDHAAELPNLRAAR
ncbi:MAG: PLP-dependent aminotransferase family protein [Betaproteobacteria bacterium]|jgi:2-aminoadipate transaminase|nr:PLP-dependent aminotransferase family protein [Betaproteobacteria bacterium]NBP45715.1 PLP-dependent aminotransferase family protein [Betaproteobacteria bacterium]